MYPSKRTTHSLTLGAVVRWRGVAVSLCSLFQGDLLGVEVWHRWYMRQRVAALGRARRGMEVPGERRRDPT